MPLYLLQKSNTHSLAIAFRKYLLIFIYTEAKTVIVERVWERESGAIGLVWFGYPFIVGWISGKPCYLFGLKHPHFLQ